MSVQAQKEDRPDFGKAPGMYLMELRHHVAELHSRRYKLPVHAAPMLEAQSVPILVKIKPR
jgi:hypothetical protein